jgi:hypothetical protein
MVNIKYVHKVKNLDERVYGQTLNRKTKMRTIRLSMVVTVVIMILCAAGMASAADNYHGGGHSGGYYRSVGHHGGHYWGGRGRSSFDFGVVIGGPYWGSPWYYPYYNPYYYPYYYPYVPAVTVPSMPQEYIEQSQEELSSTPSGVWYYCPESKAYYPYVRECPSGWQTVPAQPPSGSGR